ncbi:tripartite tricarboxylate transporter substrate-binding protein [Variovorax fucosicus]|uniref:tripartite tricarboxylate transporter substrate-binding protein n=1 Tax=Variovorax fucosicus TaxID=3053517 RepID=UPI002575434C|nr:tripartite tricarboxylate transporter substrate-binding protein [Variovorax sp. J22G47]MDM0055279.1 tripartite tricarboxylate transporter substrate-binding protein [Variovorax sp. J22G47]
MLRHSILLRPRRRALLAGAASALLAAPFWRRAQAQTSRGDVLRILCSGPAGSVPDTVARRVGEALAELDARTVVVDNRPGAAGQIAVNALKTAAPDGSTLLLAQGAIATIYPSLYARLAYDPAIDLQPVSLAGEMTLGIAVGPAVPGSVTNIRQLLVWMRQNPGLTNAGSPGTGTLPHLLEVMLFQEAGVAWEHVAYPGGPPALAGLLGGQIAVLVLPEGLLRPHRASGRLRLLATSGAQRSAFSPDVPTLVEQGHPKLVLREWFAFFLPGRTPPATSAATSQALRAAIAQPALVAAFGESAMVAASSSPAELVERIAAEQRVWAPLIRAAAIRAE